MFWDLKKFQVQNRRVPLLDFVDQLKASSDQNEVAVPVSEIHLVTFLLGDEEYGVSIQQVREIIRVSEITRVPGAPANVRGVTNLRGRIVPVFEIRTRFGLDEAVVGEETRILLVEVEKRMLGLMVDEVRQVVKVPADSVLPPPADIISEGSEHIVGVAKQGDALVILLDLDRLILGGQL